MALNKVLTANGSKGHHKFTLTVTETSTSGNSSFLSVLFTVSPIQSGWDWSASGVNYSLNIGGNTYTGAIYSYGGYSTETIKSVNNLEIPHDADGTKTITLSFAVTDTTAYTFTPGNASSSGSFVLSALHKAPDITACSITAEANNQLTTLGLSTGTIAQYLSNKTFEITATPYDNATISTYNVYHNNVLIGTSASNSVSIDFANVGELQTVESGGVHYVGLTINVIDNKSGSASANYTFPVLKYTRPTLERTTTTIKRKTTGGTTLSDNVTLLNVTGTIYKENDILGNANTPLIQYKIWKSYAEPSYSTTQVRQLDADNLLEYETDKITNYTLTDNDISVSNFEIDDVSFLHVYQYKVKISDSFSNDDEKEDNLATGVAVWSEYKDHVDFMNITKQGNEIYPNIYSTSEEIIVGKWIDNKPIYRKVFTGTITSTREEIDISLLNVETPVKIWALNNYNTLNNSWVLSGFWSDATSYFNSYIANNNLVLTNAGFTNHDYIIVFEYTKTAN